MKINENNISHVCEYVLTQEELDQIINDKEELTKIKAVLIEYLKFKSIDGNPVRQHYRHALNGLVQ